MSEPFKKPDGSEGQQPQWPGEKNKGPGRYKDGDETITVPLVDSVPGKQSDGKERD